MTEQERKRISPDLAQHIRGVAIRMIKSGVVLSMDRPARHHHLLHAWAEWSGRALERGEHEQGFMSSTGGFWTREQAARMCGHEGQLYSEDLW